MRTTLDIDDDVLSAAKEIARRNGETAGRTVSDLIRRALTQTPVRAHEVREPESFYGFRPFPPSGRIVTNELINRIRDEEGI
ncbi:MAG: hypothetical protein JSR27_05335 [Proteobacteria bacterium]|nr:hypothetical protein [Pseudomonadota bacterium]